MNSQHHADLYGKGYSEAPRTTYDPNLFITQVAMLLQFVDWKKAAIVGFSMVIAILSLHHQCKFEAKFDLFLPLGRWYNISVRCQSSSPRRRETGVYCFSGNTKCTVSAFSTLQLLAQTDHQFRSHPLTSFVYVLKDCHLNCAEAQLQKRSGPPVPIPSMSEVPLLLTIPP